MKDPVPTKVEDIKEGDKVDLESCPYFNKHPSAQFEYAEVVYVERETEDCVVIGYEGVDRAGYKVGTELMVIPCEGEE